MYRNPKRVEEAINSLIRNIVPDDPELDEETAQQRHDMCYDVANSILSK